MATHDTEARLIELMRAYQSGEAGAFDDIYHALRAQIQRYLHSLTLHSQHTEDLLQETFLQLHRARRTYVPPRPVRPWAFGIARYVYLMDRRSEARRKTRELPGEHDFSAIPAPPDLEFFPQRDEVRRALGGLPLEAREPLLLHHVWGFSFREIGSLLGLRAGTAKVRAHRALSQLRDDLGVRDAS